jgi:non-ribosomal peptide synthetase component E (peptide arylation enzyme)
MPRPSSNGAVPWPTEYAERYTAKGYWEGHAIGDRLHAVADATPDVVALVDGDRRLTYRQLAERADAVALRLAGLGLRPDDRLVVQLPNTAEFVILTYACLRLGVIPVMALPGHRRHEVGYLVEHSEAVAVAVPDHLKDHDHQAMAFDIAADSPTLRHVLVLGDKVGDDAVDVGELCAAPGRPVDRAAVDAYRPDSRSIAVFLLSGGTTGLPSSSPAPTTTTSTTPAAAPRSVNSAPTPSTSRPCPSATTSRSPARACSARCCTAAGWSSARPTRRRRSRSSSARASPPRRWSRPSPSAGWTTTGNTPAAT